MNAQTSETIINPNIADSVISASPHTAILAQGAESTNPAELFFDGTLSAMVGVGTAAFTSNTLFSLGKTRSMQGKNDWMTFSGDTIAPTEAEAKKRKRIHAIAAAVGSLAAATTFMMTHGN